MWVVCFFLFLVVLVFLVECMLDFLVVFLRQFMVYYGLLEQEFLLMVVCCYLVEWGSFWVGNHSRYVSIMPRYVFLSLMHWQALVPVARCLLWFVIPRYFQWV